MVGDKTKLKIKYLKILPAGKFFLESQFLPSLTNEVMSKKRELDFDEEVVRNAIENIYTKIYEEVFEIK